MHLTLHEHDYDDDDIIFHFNNNNNNNNNNRYNGCSISLHSISPGCNKYN